MNDMFTGPATDWLLAQTEACRKLKRKRESEAGVVHRVLMEERAEREAREANGEPDPYEPMSRGELQGWIAAQQAEVD